MKPRQPRNSAEGANLSDKSNNKRINTGKNIGPLISSGFFIAEIFLRKEMKCGAAIYYRMRKIFSCKQ